MRAVAARPADRADRQGAQLGVAQPAVAQQPQQRMIALADQRAAVRERGAGCRTRPPTASPAARHDATAPARPRPRVEPELRQQRAEHRQMHAPRRRRRRAAATAAVALKRAAVGGDRVRGHVADHGRAAELVAQRVAEARVDRPVLARARRPGRARGDELADGVEVGLAAAARRPAALATASSGAEGRRRRESRQRGYRRSRPSWLYITSRLGRQKIKRRLRASPPDGRGKRFQQPSPASRQSAR